MDVPKPIIEAVDKANKKHPNSIPDAVEAAKAGVRKLPEFEEYREFLLHQAIKELIYDGRHKATVANKRRIGHYDTTPKVTGVSDAINEVYRIGYDTYFAGRTLGDIRGDELPAIESSERALANGHTFNAELAKWLQPIVHGDKRIHEAIPEKKLRTNYKRIYRQVNGMAA